jgi:acyl-CoA synthetase (NDP forming)
MPSTIQPELKPLFEPESIAVIGASTASNKWDN